MDKSTIRALVVAGAGVIGAVFQVLVLRAAKKRKRDEYEATTRKREGALPWNLKDS